MRADFFVHYSGHGSKIKDMNNDEKSGYALYPWIIQLQASSWMTLFSYIRESKCPSTNNIRQLQLGDRGRSAIQLHVRRVFQNDWLQIKQQLQIKQPKHSLISGCRDDQYSADAYQDYGGLSQTHSEEFGNRKF
jgi:hypothetical protein